MARKRSIDRPDDNLAATRDAAMRHADAQEPSHEPPQPPPREPFPIVGVGCSAGGLEALRRLFVKMPTNSGMAFVVIQHLDPTRESLMTEILARYTEIPVAEVEDGMPVEPNRIYMILPNRELTIREGRLHLADFIEQRGRRRPVDAFFRSLAVEQHERAIAVVLTGTGSNGSEGLKAIKSLDGMIMVQAPETAEYDGMPRAAIETGLVDFILPVEKMADALVSYVSHPYIREGALRAQEEAAQRHINEILALINARAGHDFRCYKKATLMRRIARRMGLLGIERLPAYAAHLREQHDELQHLVRDLLITVTNFFRDPKVWEALERVVIEPLVKSREIEAPIRVWVPACSTGEEAYTIAMLLDEHVTAANKYCPIKVFATDPVEGGLSYARLGCYPDSIELDLPPERLTRFFEREHSRYVVKKHIRESVVFAPQNLLNDPPFSRLDLISCRNLLIYLEPEVQQQVIALFHFALNEGGYLLLGSAETIGRHDDLFEPVSKSFRIYRKVGPTRHDRVDFPLSERLEPRSDSELLSRPRRRPAAPERLVEQALLQAFAPPSVLVDHAFQVLHIHGQADQYLTHPPGPPTRDVRSLVREELRSALRAALKRVDEDRRRVTVSSRRRSAAPVAVTVTPLENRGTAGLLLISFEESQRTERGRIATRPAQPVEEPPADRRLEDELRSTREELESTIEELETSNEELKASNEEATSINEELQSANEELETSKEELQSLNEELHTVNHQLEAKLEEFEELTNDLSNLLTSTDIAVLFLDTSFRVRRFTPPMTRLVRLVPGDVGRPIGDITQRFADESLVPDAEAVLATLVPIEKEVSSDDGRWFLRRVLPYRTQDNRIAGVVITFLDITRRKLAEDELKELNQELELRVVQRTRALKLLHDVAIVANEAATIEQALQHAMERVGRYLGWPVGHAWVPSPDDPNVFVSSGIWVLNPPEQYRDLAASRGLERFRAGQGIVGEVLQTRKPRWVGDLSQVPQRIGIEAVSDAELQSAAAYPVLVRDRVVSVLEFFDGRLTEPNKELLEDMQQLGIELGRVFERQELEREVARIAEEEQRRFAHELHDSVAQELTGISMMAACLRREMREDRPPRAELIQKLVDQVGVTQRQVHGLARGMMPVELDAAGLGVALATLAERTQAATGIACRFESPRAVRVEKATAAMHLYRIAQEALHNALRHADASQIVIELDQSEPDSDSESTVTLSVSDNGRGMDLSRTPGGMGRRIMRYRANLIGARLKLESQPQHGTTVICELSQAEPTAPANLS
ncbi:MAG: PAS domain-containing protein [Planctomycetes bacterium]|nr:PAS domain-containing protein [Planctomycetota bacterium]